MRSLILCIALVSVAHAETISHDQSPYQLDPSIDVPIFLGGAPLWILPYEIASPTAAPPECGNPTPCDAGKLNALDRLTVGWHDTDARLVANLTLLTPAAFFLFMNVIDVGVTNWRSYLTDATVMLESLVLDGILDEIVRRAVRRPRPYLYQAGVYPEERNLAEATFSFYSGHTSGMFNMMSGLSYTWTLRHPDSRYRYLVWTALLAMATIEPIARVISGDHFPTDCIVGALIGTSLGVLIPALHRRKSQVMIAPAMESNGASLRLIGQF